MKQSQLICVFTCLLIAAIHLPGCGTNVALSETAAANSTTSAGVLKESAVITSLVEQTAQNVLEEVLSQYEQILFEGGSFWVESLGKEFTLESYCAKFSSDGVSPNKYTLLYESAPATNPHTPCTWTMRKASEYLLPAEELVGADLSNDSDAISVQFQSDGIPYLLTTTSRDKSDFKVNMIACSIYDGLCPGNLDERIFSARLCRTEEPTQTQLDAAKQKAESVLEAFNLGQWQVDECFYTSESYGNQTEYHICVNAVPAFDGVLALRRPQLTGLRNEDGDSARQYFSDVQFVFAPTGELISFTLTTPLEIQGMSTQDSLGAEQLITRAQEVMTLTDAAAYGLGDLVQFIPEEVLCEVTVSEIKCGLSRIKVPEQENSYYYVPSIALYGTAENLGVQTGKTYYCSEELELLFLLNALDGSLIKDIDA